MQMDYGLKLELAHKLVMTPQLRQAITILQLSSVELAELLEKELLENLVLEVEEKQAAEAEDQQPAPEVPTNDYFDWAEYFNDGTDTGFTARPEGDDDRPGFETFTSSGPTLHDHLEFQLHLAVLDDAARKVGKYLIGCIDDNGYFRGTPGEAAERLGVSARLVQDVLRVIQTFDPPGAGARDLRECLLIQAAQKGIDDELVLGIIDRHLDDIGAGRYKALADRLGCLPHDIQTAVDIIRTLDPKPGRAFGSGNDLCYIFPDVTVERVNGEYIILINDSNVPHLMVNPYYRRVVRDGDAEAKRYVEGRINAAVWLIRSIEQRRRTLYNVMSAIIELQREFFDYGPKYLQPLTMKKVADRVSVHESTVSRATANKYVATPHGLFSFRVFFSASVHGVDGGNLSAARVKQDIRELIAGEDSAKPLSDQILAYILNKRGVAVSRRTVAKYREELEIPASSKRKRY